MNKNSILLSSLRQNRVGYSVWKMFPDVIIISILFLNCVDWQDNIGNVPNRWRPRTVTSSYIHVTLQLKQIRLDESSLVHVNGSDYLRM